MFGNKEKPETAPREPARTVTRSHVAEGMAVKGDIEGDIDLLLEGRLEGNLRCRSVTIGKTGEVVGKIVAQEALVDGKIVGDIEAKTVKLNATAEMIGDVRHEVIEVSGGARIEGHYGRIASKAQGKPVGKSASGRALATEKTAPPKAPAAGPSKVDGSGVPEAAEISVTAPAETSAAKPN